jgi:hypothetical protein
MTDAERLDRKYGDKTITDDYVRPSGAVPKDTFCASGWVLPSGRWVTMVHGEHIEWALANGFSDTDNLIRVRPCPTIFRFSPDRVNADVSRYRGKMIFHWVSEPSVRQIDTVFYLCMAMSREKDWQRFRKAVDANVRGEIV